MERKLNQDEFDQFLKENADDLRLRPSASVWENIAQELNRKKRRTAGIFILALTLVSGTLATWFTLTLPDDAGAAPAAAVQNTTGNYSASALESSVVNATSEQVKGSQAPATFRKSRKTKTATARVVSERIADWKTAIAATPVQMQTVTAVPEISNEETASVTDRPAPDSIPLLTASGETISTQLQVQQPTLEVEETATEVTPEPEAGTPSPSLNISRKKSKLNWTLFITPTVSYRKLSENKSFERPFLTPGTPPMVSALYNINNAVIHKPDLGLEFGVMTRYQISNDLKVRTGFQFNISRYDIRAFSYVPEVATIALSNGFGVDSVRAISSYRNFNGGRSNWLQNFYFQASLPIGMELKVAGNKNLQWHLASSIQPTYVIGNRAYLITPDYKNYARVPWLTRRWNMNSSFETFVSYRSGKTEWHVGPQVRYQIFSSFVRKYPVKENLFDFGMKVGITIR